MAESFTTLISHSLRTLLKETMFRAASEEAYVINRNEPGFIDTLKSLTAKVVSTPPRPGRKPIVSHANHVLYGLGLVSRALDGDMKAFADADWDVAWKLERVNDAEWAELLGRLEATAQHVLDAASQKVTSLSGVMLTGTLGIAAHTAYHLAAVRQILLDVKK